MLYTTVTVSDFKDVDYINQLQKLNIGMELALLTKIPDQLKLANVEDNLNDLKQELAQFVESFDQFNIPLHEIRIHQPGGYLYNWSAQNSQSGFDTLKMFFDHCYAKGFRHFVIHSPYGNAEMDANTQVNNFREKLSSLLSQGPAHLEVEEISASCSELHNKNLRCYHGSLFKLLMRDQKATVLLDVHECGSVNATIKRLKQLIEDDFTIHSIHIHKDKHKFLTPDELGLLLKSGFRENIINEGFLNDSCSFDEFVKSPSPNCVVPNNQRITILEAYKKEIGKLD